MNIQSTIVEEDREKVMSSIISLTEESPVRTFENKIIRHDGKIRWIRWTDRALFDDKGQVTSCQSFGEDITDMKEAQEAIWQEKDKAQKYLDISEVIMLVLNKKGEITLINQKGNRILGYQEDELIGKNWFETCLPERNRKEIKQVFNKIMAGSTDFIEHHENPVLTRSGEKRIIAWHNTVLRDEKGNSIGILSSGEDITNRVRAEQLMNALNRASAAIGKSLTHEEIFNAVAVELKQLDISCMLFPLDETQDKLITKYISYESALLNAAEKLVGIEHKDYSFPIDAVDICREVVRDKKTLFMDDSEQTLRQILPKLTKKILVQITNILRVQKNITAPLIIEGQVIGVFSVQSETLAREDIPTATAFADQLSSAWNKIKLLQNLRKTVEGTIHTIAATVEARDPYTAGHQTRVADLAAAIASEMHLSKNQVEGIRMAGIIHDLGKINIPAEILSKPGKISEIEYKIIQTHPQVGFDLLKEIEFPWPIALMVHQHHEKMDGSGYPQGLKGEEILLEARILAVADTVEAMSSHRPYRPAYGIEKALEQIRHDKGTLLDPKVVDACLKVFEDGYKLPEG
jgi:PAS domain S-box-containing protein/putative nucleotidyltransferase with HDIG domain